MKPDAQIILEALKSAIGAFERNDAIDWNCFQEGLDALDRLAEKLWRAYESQLRLEGWTVRLRSNISETEYWCEIRRDGLLSHHTGKSREEALHSAYLWASKLRTLTTLRGPLLCGQNSCFEMLVPIVPESKQPTLVTPICPACDEPLLPSEDASDSPYHISCGKANESRNIAEGAD